MSAVDSAPARTRPDWRRLLALLAIAHALGLLLTLAGSFWYLAELLNSFRGQLLVSAIGLLLVTTSCRCWWSSGMLAAGLTLTASPVLTCWSAGAAPLPPGQVLRVMSWNLLIDTTDGARVQQVIQEANPDVVLLLEYDLHWHQQLEQLRTAYPHTVCQPRNSAYGLALLSRVPLRNTRFVEWEPQITEAPQLITELALDRGTLRLAGVHLASPINARRWRLRDRQLELAGETLAAPRQPTLVLGDFNCVPWSRPLREFQRVSGLRDSRRGFGFQASWPRGLGPLKIPIDHALVSPEVQVLNRFVGAASASDHLPIVLDIAIDPLGSAQN